MGLSQDLGWIDKGHCLVREQKEQAVTCNMNCQKVIQQRSKGETERERSKHKY